MADALLERTVIWPLDGEVIPTASCVSQIDPAKYMTLEQYSIIIGFLENINLYFDKEANEQMVAWCDELKLKSKNRINPFAVCADVKLSEG